MDICESLVDVAGNLHLVVVVTHRIEEGYVPRGKGLVHGIDEIGQVEIIADPIHIPGVVAEGNGIYLSGSVVNIIEDSLRHFGELLKVVGTAGQMDVTEHEEPEVLDRRLYELEVCLLGGKFIFVERFVIRGTRSVKRSLITCRYGDEYILPFLIGMEGITTLGVGLDDIDAVRDKYVGNALSATGNDTVNVQNFRIRDIIERGAVHSSCHIFLCSSSAAKHSAAFGIPDDNTDTLLGVITGSYSDEPGLSEFHAVRGCHLVTVYIYAGNKLAAIAGRSKPEDG